MVYTLYLSHCIIIICLSLSFLIEMTGFKNKVGKKKRIDAKCVIKNQFGIRIRTKHFLSGKLF